VIAKVSGAASGTHTSLPKGTPKGAFRNALILIVALAGVLGALYQLEKVRAGIEVSNVSFGSTPATRYHLADSQGPIVIGHCRCTSDDRC